MKIAVLGIDLGNSVVGLDSSGAVVLRQRVRRDTLIDLVDETNSFLRALAGLRPFHLHEPPAECDIDPTGPLLQVEANHNVLNN